MYVMELIRCCCNDVKRLALVSDHLRKNVCRSISVSASNYLKEIHRTETENQIVIEGVKVKSDREGRVINDASKQGCPLCKLGLRHVRHTDILILSQFINSDGTLISQDITGLCNKQHFRVLRAVGLAQKADFNDEYITSSRRYTNSVLDCQLKLNIPPMITRFSIPPAKEGKRFQCDFCKLSFWKKYDFQNHMRTHTGERPYSCLMCGSKFSRSFTLNRHHRRAHGGHQVCHGTPINSKKKRSNKQKIKK